jgi:F-type H+-transporting ATPase subunit b
MNRTAFLVRNLRRLFSGLMGALVGLLVCPSPQILLASGGGGHAEVESPFTLLMRVINFLLLVALLYVLLKKPIRNFLNRRQQEVREALETAEKARDEAEIRYQEVEKKLRQAQTEMEELKRILVEQGQVEKEKLIASAKEEAEKIRREAEITASQEFKKAQVLLRKEAVELAANLAETLLRDKVSEKDHERLLQEYLNTLEKTS